MDIPFSQQTLDFLFENRLQDSRIWFGEHKTEYQSLVIQPLRQLVMDLTPTMLELDPEFQTEPRVDKTICRIWRDTRYTKDPSLYRDHMWIIFKRGGRMHGTDYPGVYFEISLDGFSYGCGWYCPGTERMEALRRLILSGDREVLRAVRAMDRQRRFRMEGDDLVFLAEGSDNFLYVQLSEGERFYGEVLPDTPSGVTKWLDYTEEPSQMDWDGEETMELPEFPGVTFRYTPERITAWEDGEEVLLITGMPIWNVYFEDLTGDGLPEVCATLSWGSGIVDTRVVIYDYANGASYTLEDRMFTDYALRYEEADGLLYVDQRAYNSGELLSSGPLVYADGCIQVEE